MIIRTESVEAKLSFKIVKKRKNIAKKRHLLAMASNLPAMASKLEALVHRSICNYGG